ncbi:MAG TPA: OB-fold domain-containing protein, partial [Marmoricola sp.]|nr:OB-fold domain-containing protein [Marmoricola sp.]
KCNACGELRHPPGPMCPVCHAADRGYVVAAGAGTIYSFLTHHAPQLPGKELPLQLGLIELPEGVRMVGELIGEDPQIGDAVEATYEKIDDDTTLVYWRKS